METLATFVIAAVVTWFFVRGYLKKLTAAKTAGRSHPEPARAEAIPSLPCPRCAQPTAKTAAFCQHCGAPMAMWSVQRAEIEVSAGGAKPGRPKPVINASLCVGCGSCVHACPEQGTLEVISGKAILAHPDRCVGHTDCASACPTSAITMAIDGALQRVRVPLVKENFETNVPGIFIAGELGGMGLIKTAINEGRLAVDHIRARLGKEAPAGGDIYDLAIVGGGPAGLSASLTAQQHGLRYLTLEQGEIASTIRQYPRQKFLMAEPIDIPLYGSLYVADTTKEALLAVWESIIANTGVQIRTNEKVEGIRRNGVAFHVQTPRGEYRARYIVLSIGKRGTPRRLGVPGEDSCKVAYRLIEAGDYQGKNILVVGGGDSALEAALALSRNGSNRVTLCHRGAHFSRTRERNRQAIDTAHADGRVEVLFNTTVSRIVPDSVILDGAGETRSCPNDLVFILAGGESPHDFLQKAGVQIVERVLRS
jgi:thioredoxin reductase (NADPH)